MTNNKDIYGENLEHKEKVQKVKDYESSMRSKYLFGLDSEKVLDWLNLKLVKAEKEVTELKRRKKIVETALRLQNLREDELESKVHAIIEEGVRLARIHCADYNKLGDYIPLRNLEVTKLYKHATDLDVVYFLELSVSLKPVGNKDEHFVVAVRTLFNGSAGLGCKVIAKEQLDDLENELGGSLKTVNSWY